MRLFVSVDLPARLADAIADCQAEIAHAAGVRFTEPTQAHFTLRFLGAVDPDRVPAIESELEAAVSAADLESFRVTLGGLGTFPSEEYIRVIWLGVLEGKSPFYRLHEAVDTRITAMGFPAAEHEFTPHVTIARVDHAGGKSLVQEALREGTGAVGELTVSSIALTESTLTADGPVYDTIARFRL